MAPSLFLKMLLLAAVALLLTSSPSYEARIILQNPMKRNQDQVPPTVVPVPHPLSQKALASDQINVSSLLGGLDWAPHVPVPPSAPSPGTYIPSSAMRQRKNPPHPSMLHNASHVSPPNPFSQKASAGDQINVSSLRGGLDWAPHVPVPPSAPSPGTYIPSSAMTQTKNPPHPSMLHDAYHVSPPNLSTRIIPPSTTTSHNPAPLLGTPQMSPQPLSVNTAPLLGTPQMSPQPLSVNTAPLPQKSPLPPSVNIVPLLQKSPLPPSVNTAPLLGTLQKSPLPPSVNTVPSPQKSPLPPFVSNRRTSIP